MLPKDHPVPPDGAVTVIAAVPLCPPVVAVIVTAPATTPVTSPLPLTVATALLLLAQLTVPLSTLPTASLAVATSCTVCPTVTVAEAGLTVTDANGPGGSTAVVPLATFERPPNTALDRKSVV